MVYNKGPEKLRARMDRLHLDHIQGLHYPIFEDLLHCLLGECLGSGVSRTVFAHATDTELVVKVANDTSNLCMQNINEFKVWDWYSDGSKQGEWMCRWLAPVHYISPAGHILIMTRAKPADTLPKRVPPFLNDVHPGNWGMINGRHVMVDYGSVNLIVPDRKLVPFRAAAM